MPSFDVVSEVNMEEARNAVENAQRELTTRFDFRGVDASFEWTDKTAKVSAESDFQIQQMLDILRGALLKRKIDTSILEISDPLHSGKTFSSIVSFKQGIDALTAKKIVKMIKVSKMKVQSAIQGEQVRVTGKKRDDLQGVMSLLKASEEIEIPLQFDNFRD